MECGNLFYSSGGQSMPQQRLQSNSTALLYLATLSDLRLEVHSVNT